jgi:hypothetical protein
MVKQVRHIQASKLAQNSRKYSGESGAVTLVRWLNECKDVQAKNRIRGLLNGVMRMMGAAAVMPAAASYTDGDEWGRHPGVKSFEARQRYVNRLLKRYRAVPQVMAWKVPRGSGEVLDWHFSWSPTEEWSSVRRGLSEFGAVVAIFSLGTKGLFRLRPCGCGKAFFKRFAHQKFCSDVCRIKFYSNDPKWKAYRAGKARDYYWLHKKKNIK